MNKLSNKGFAISTIIYGISIVGILLVGITMATMSTNRKNSNTFSETLDEELSRYGKTETIFMPSTSTPTPQKYIVPEGEDGWYKIELWGAQGGSSGGNGAYTSGVIELKARDEIYFYVGKERNGYGGYETDVRTISGGYNDATSYQSRIMVAAGGGTYSIAGAGTSERARASGGTLYANTTNMYSFGGHLDANYQLTTTGNTTTNNTLVGLKSDYSTVDSYQQPTSGTYSDGPSRNNTSGDGYYAGTNSNNGGISFVSGYAGSRAKSGNNISGTSVVSTQITNNMTSETRNMVFLDGMMIAGAKPGDGSAKIEKIKAKEEGVTELPRKNVKFNNVRYIRACVSSYNPNAETLRDNTYIAVMYNKGTTYERTGAQGTNETYDSLYCKKYDLGAGRNIDEIAVWHTSNKAGGIDIIDNSIFVSPNNSTWYAVKDRSYNPETGAKLNTSSAYLAVETELPTGARVSAYQHDPTIDIPTIGNYYILPVVSENEVITSYNKIDEADPLKIKYLEGSKLQKWSIEEQGGSKKYKILDLLEHRSIAIEKDENLKGNEVIASYTYNLYAQNEPQMWYIKPLKDGTYIIKTIQPSVSDDNNVGCLVANTTNDNNKLVIGTSSYKTERFKLIDINY